MCMVKSFRCCTSPALWVMVLLFAGCAGERSPRDLGDRLQTELAPELASGDVTLQRLPDGARVTLGDQMLFPAGGTELNDRGRFVLASLAEGLLAPPLLLVDVSGPAEPLPRARAGAIAQYLRAIQVAPNLLFTSLQQGARTGGASPQATTIMVLSPGHSSRTGHPT